MNGMGNVNQMSNMMARAGASQAGVRSLPGSIWNMASRMSGGETRVFNGVCLSAWLGKCLCVSFGLF